MKRLLVLLSIAGTIFYSSCSKCDEDFIPEYDFAIFFYMYDKQTKENLLQIASVYNRDSTLIYDEDQHLVFTGPVPGDGRVVFSPLNGSNNKRYELSIEKEELYYLHLYSQGRGGHDIDTLKLNYLIQNNDCNQKEFTYLNIYHNDSLVFSQQNWTRFATFNLYK